MRIPETLQVIETPDKGYGIITTVDIQPGEFVFQFNGVFVSPAEATWEALQIDDDLFLESTDGFDNYLNHSCDPNCYIDFDGVKLIALRHISKGEELSFNYLTTEYDLIEQGCAFECQCGSIDCLHQLRGFRYLTLEQKIKLRDFLSPFLKRVLERELNQIADSAPEVERAVVLESRAALPEPPPDLDRP